MDLARDISAAAATPQSGVSLATLLSFGQQAASQLAETTSKSAHFLKAELPVRFAHRVVELDTLPHGLAGTPSITKVKAWYAQSFAEIRAFPPLRSQDDVRRFSDLLEQIYERHNPTIVTVARGVAELRHRLGVRQGEPLPAAVEESTRGFLDKFFTSRVGVRTLISQHLAMHHPRDLHVGIINTQCRPFEAIEAAVADARMLCERRYGDSPGVDIAGCRDFSFAYVPSYIHHVLFELLKNAMRAVVETHGGGGAMPRISIVMSAASNSEDVVIKVADKGGGIPRSAMDRMWSYFYTTAPAQFPWPPGAQFLYPQEGSGGGDEAMGAADFTTAVPMAGLGVGLPLSRVYARYFGGDVQIVSMEGHGTDAYVFLRRLGDSAEPLSEREIVMPPVGPDSPASAAATRRRL